MFLRNHVEKTVARTNRPGFTLMEVLVVVAILVVVAGVGGIAYFGYLEKANEDAARLGIKNVETAVMAWKYDHGEFPQQLTDLTVPVEGRHAALDADKINDPWKRPYHYEPQTLSPTGKPLIYSMGANGQTRIANWGEGAHK